MNLDEASRRLDRWTQSLLDLIPRDRLIDRTDVDEAFLAVPFELATGGGSFELASTALAPPRPRADGDHVTWLAIGVLWWSARGDDARVRRAPLVLAPVELRRTAGGTLVERVGAVRINTALVDAVRREAEVELPAPTGPFDPAQALDAIAARIAELRPAWAIERAAYVTTLSLAGVALWADLARAEPGAPLLRRMLATEPAGALPPLAAPALPLDADGEQAGVIAAALAGHSVAVLAPPGTGAAQTAANLVAAAIADGKTALVVSTRAAALRAVRRHLAGIGVAEFCLPLGLLDDGRTVARELAAVADRSWRPGGAAVGAIDRREQVAAALDDYALALHQPTSLGLSMFDAVARLIELRTSPRLAPAAIDLAGLDPAELARRRTAVATYARAATAVAPIGAHPWRTSTLTELAPGAGTVPIAEALAATAAAATELAGRLAGIVAVIPGLAPRTRAELEAAGALFAIAAKTPRPGADLIATGPAPASDREVRVDPSRALPASAIPRDPAAYVALARRQRKLRDELARRWTPAIAELDLDGLAAAFRAASRKAGLVRWLALRGPRAEVRAVLAGGKLPDDLTIAADLDTAAEERAARRLLGEAAGPARRWFGQLAGVHGASDLPDLDALELDEVDAALWWARELRAAFDAVPVAGSRDPAWRALIAQVCAPHISARADAADPSVDPGFAEAAAAVDAWRRALAGLADVAGVDARGITDDRGHLAALADQLAAWREALPHLPAWTEYVRARSAARAAGLAPVVASCESGQLATDQAAEAWERAILLAVIGERIGAAPALAQFHGPSHHARVVELADLTRAAQLAVRSRNLARLAERVPRRGRDGDDATAVLAHELARPVARTAGELLVDAADLTPRLAPCLLASPAAVAAHLDPELAPFDLVILLEAGAMPAAFALGALARAHTAVVLGTPGEATAFEAAAARLPTLRLSTHYRSRHEDLIAFASERWFGGALTIFPASAASPGRLGVDHRAIEGDAAEAVATAVLAHLGDPERQHQSLAVIGFDRELLARIEDRLAAARAADPALDRFFAAPAEPEADDAPERVLVTDAASADGEVRDTVILAVDRAVESDRALITAVTRAREHLIVMAAIAPPPGDLGALLAFAQGARGPVDAAPASPMAAAIGAALTGRGWIVRHRVGAGPYRVDLAVVDPDDPGRTVLGIETDGPVYGAGGGAGDRDRLRAQALAARGWRLHRIWCLDWWTDPDREAQRAHGAVIAAIAAVRQARRPTQPRITPRWTRPLPAVAADAAPDAAGLGDSTAVTAAPGSAPIVAGSAPVADGSAPRVARGSRPTAARSPQLALGLASRMSPQVAPYQAASVPAGRRRPDDMFEPRHAGELGQLIDRVLEVEAPIHLALLARRVGAYFGVGKITPRITELVRAALAGHGQPGDEPDVIWRLDQDPAAPAPVRVAAEAIESRRDIDEVPLVEIAGAATVVVDRAAGLAVPDLVRDAARLLGYARITDRVLERVKAGVELANKTGAIALDGERASRP